MLGFASSFCFAWPTGIYPGRNKSVYRYQIVEPTLPTTLGTPLLYDLYVGSALIYYVVHCPLCTACMHVQLPSPFG